MGDFGGQKNGDFFRFFDFFSILLGIVIFIFKVKHRGNSQNDRFSVIFTIFDKIEYIGVFLGVFGCI